MHFPTCPSVAVNNLHASIAFEVLLDIHHIDADQVYVQPGTLNASQPVFGESALTTITAPLGASEDVNAFVSPCVQAGGIQLSL